MTTLVDRYIDVALADIPKGARGDTGRDMRGMIDELVEARAADGVSQDAAAEQALNELGDPRRLASQFGDAQRYLIGPANYGTYLDLVKALLTKVLPLVALAMFVTNVMQGDETVGSVLDGVLDTAGSTFIVGVQMLFWVTVAFAVLERTGRTPVGMPGVGMDDATRWTVADLPPVAPRRKISIGDALVSLGFTLFVGVILVMVYRNGITMYLGDDGRAATDGTVPFFNPDIPDVVPWLVLGLLGADVALGIARCVGGFWTARVAAAEIGLSVGWVVLALVVIGGWELVNPGIAAVTSVDVAETLLSSWFELSVLATVIAVAAYEVWEAVRGYLAQRPAPDPWTV